MMIDGRKYLPDPAIVVALFLAMGVMVISVAITLGTRQSFSINLTAI